MLTFEMSPEFYSLQMIVRQTVWADNSYAQVILVAIEKEEYSDV